jgi:hypothetical protein
VRAVTESEEQELVWDQLTDPSQSAFADRMHELTGLVHYTNFGALEGIVRNREVWFNSVMSMNDYDEVVKGKQLLEEMAKADGPLHEVIKSILHHDEELGKLFDESYRDHHESDLFDTFVSCWSTCDPGVSDHDNLTMWRGYASEGNGVAIVINPLALGLDRLFQSHIIICPVYYETEAEFAARANRALTFFHAKLHEVGSDLLKKHSGFAASAFAEVCFHLAVTHKHPQFAPEKEWRFVWRKHKEPNEHRIRYLQSKLTARGLYEFFCFPIETDPEIAPTELNIHKLIAEVMVGPTDDAYLKYRAVRTLLLQHGFDLEQTKITTSKIPFRTKR